MLILFQPFFWLWKCFPIFPPQAQVALGSCWTFLAQRIGKWALAATDVWRTSGVMKHGWESSRYGESKEDVPIFLEHPFNMIFNGKKHIHKSWILNSNVWSRQATLNRSPSVLFGRPLHLEPILSHDSDLDPVFFLVVPVICYSLPWTMAQYGWCLNDLALNNGDFP